MAIPVALGVLAFSVGVGIGLVYAVWNLSQMNHYHNDQRYNSPQKTSVNVNIYNNSNHYSGSDADRGKNNKDKRRKTNKTCSICLKVKISNIITLSCSHSFHIYCIAQWKSKNFSNACPVCG